jgi:phosphate butyryltransferase
MIHNFNEMLADEGYRPPQRLAVAAAADRSVLAAVKEARGRGLAQPLLFGDANEIRRICESLHLRLPDDAIVHCASDLDAARLAVQAVSEGRAEVLMKGMIHTDDFLRAVLNKEVGLRTGALLSHVFLCEIDAGARLLFVTDAAMNIAPDLTQKAQILLNAVYLARIFRIEKPKVAVCAAVEVVNPAMPHTLEAAALSKMSDRGQFKDCIIDGPFALDNAVSPHAARVKKIHSPVAGHADIVLCPDVESGNMMVKCFAHLAGGRLAGVIVGAAAPIVLTSRADNAEAKMLSIAVATRMAAVTRMEKLKIGKVRY